jgi:hypothetical protein
MPRSTQLFIIATALLSLVGCKKQERTPASSGKIEVPIDGGEPAPVQFDLKLSPGAPNSKARLFDCWYTARGKTARFRLELEWGPMPKDSFPVVSGEGRFTSVPGSDNSVLLEELKKALDAKQMPGVSQRVPELLFSAAVIGEKQSRTAGGGFSDHPLGDWVLVKLFLPKGGDDGEVFLNFNPVLGKGEFSIKDSDYGDYVLNELAKVL